MAWLISRALMADFENSHFSQVRAGESSGANSSGGEPSAPSSETHTPQAYCASDRMREFSRPSRSGMTFAVLTESLGEGVLTWCQAGSRVRTSPQRDGEQASTESGPASGVRWRELFKRYDPATSSWKTHRCLFGADLPESSVILPRWGMMRDGGLSERLTLALPTSGNVSGLLPTPRATDGSKGSRSIEGTMREMERGRNLDLGMVVKMWPTPNTEGYRSDGELKLLAEMVGDTPEFQAMSSRDCRSKKRAALRRLGNDANAVTIGGATGTDSTQPTAIVQNSTNGNGPDTTHINQVRKMFLTPTCQDAKNNGSASQQVRNTKPLNVVVGGSLNPTWVEWLMGWPIGWTDLGPLGTDKFRQWLHSHGDSSRKPNKP